MLKDLLVDMTMLTVDGHYTQWNQMRKMEHNGFVITKAWHGVIWIKRVNFPFGYVFVVCTVIVCVMIIRKHYRRSHSVRHREDALWSMNALNLLAWMINSGYVRKSEIAGGGRGSNHSDHEYLSIYITASWPEVHKLSETWPVFTLVLAVMYYKNNVFQ